jgi:hypothetical protein
VVADTSAAVVGVPLLFGLAYFFTDQIKAIMADLHRAERWLGLCGLLALAVVLGVLVWRWQRRVGQAHRETTTSFYTVVRVLARFWWIGFLNARTSWVFSSTSSFCMQ